MRTLPIWKRLPCVFLPADLKRTPVVCRRTRDMKHDFGVFLLLNARYEPSGLMQRLIISSLSPSRSPVAKTGLVYKIDKGLPKEG